MLLDTVNILEENLGVKSQTFLIAMFLPRVRKTKKKINTRDYMKLSFLSLKGHKGPLSLKAKLNKSLHKTQSLQLFLFYSKEYQLNHNNAKNAASNIKNTVIALINDMKKCWS